MFEVTKCVGITCFSLSNQNSESWVRILPLPGTPLVRQVWRVEIQQLQRLHFRRPSYEQNVIFLVQDKEHGCGRTFRNITSYAEIRSVATNRRWSGEEVAYTSRTFPFERSLRAGKFVVVRAAIRAGSKDEIGELSRKSSAAISRYSEIGSQVWKMARAVHGTRCLFRKGLSASST